MERRLCLIDSNSLYTTSQTYYRGRVDYRFLMERLRDENGMMEMEVVVFHGEPKKTSSHGFLEILRSMGYSVVVIPPRYLTNSSVDVRSVPLHVVSYLFPRMGRFTHFDFVAGDVDYSPVTSYLMQAGFHVRLWLFGDRIPSFGQDEEVSHLIVPLNERYILKESFKPRDGEPKSGGYQAALDAASKKALAFLDSPHEGSGTVEFGGEGTEKAEQLPASDVEGKRKAVEDAKSPGEKIGLAIDMGLASKTGCEEI